MGAHAERLSEKSRSNRRNSGAINQGPFEIEINGQSDVEKYFRNKNTDVVKSYNSQIRQWGATVKSDLLSEIDRQNIRGAALKASLKNRYYSDGKFASGSTDTEIDRIGFGFRYSGVYVHLGVGRGYFRKNGVTHRDVSSEHLRYNSVDKQRRPKPWFNPVIEKHIDDLILIVRNYSEDIVINSMRIFITS